MAIGLIRDAPTSIENIQSELIHIFECTVSPSEHLKMAIALQRGESQVRARFAERSNTS